jgi:outer membrane beta-barrel protein
MKLPTPVVAALFALNTTALAEETVKAPIDLGVLTNPEISVVQRQLYTMADQNELAFHAGLMAFDAYTKAPHLLSTYTMHKSESYGYEISVAAGYGMKSKTYRELESATYGVATEAYRFLAKVGGGIEYSPIYAKMNWLGEKIFHHNIYATAGVVAAIEQSVLPAADIAVSPGMSLGLGLRLWRLNGGAIRFELRDDVLLQRRAQSETTHLKQNVGIAIGVSSFSGGN